jgi:glutamate formiminotransferase/formiminotetrahydrofolate cyclodeaminase
VGALALRACIRGAFLNARINAAGLNDNSFAAEIINRGSEIESAAATAEDEILKLVDLAISKQKK